MQSSAAALTTTDSTNLKLVSRGKVRDIYETSQPDTLLFVATDRISAYDVILNNGIPDKGKLLTQLSLFWFNKLSHIIPNHLITSSLSEMPSEVQEYASQLDGRTMLVRKTEVVPIEAIVRGYLTGSAWAEYRAKGTVHGIPLPDGLVESEKLPKPLFTPSTKAAQGEHDENIHPDKAAILIGAELADYIASVSLELYMQASEYAAARGVILADTKFEFGLVPEQHAIASLQRGVLNRVILIDEVLTPDSSRYWPVATYEPGGAQPSYDKQYLRDWLTESGFKKGLERGPSGHEGQGWTIAADVVQGTRERYQQAVRLLTDKTT